MKERDNINFNGGAIMHRFSKMFKATLMLCLILGLTGSVYAFTANNCQNPKNRVSFCESKKDAGRARIGLKGVTKKCQSTYGAGNVSEVKSCIVKNSGIWLGSKFEVGQVEVAVAKKTVKKTVKRKRNNKRIPRKVELEKIFCGSGPVGKNQECWMTSAELSKEDVIENGIGKFERICDDDCVYSKWSETAIVSCNDGFMKQEGSCIVIPSTEDHVLCALADGTFSTVDRNAEDFDPANCGVVVHKPFDPKTFYWLFGGLFILFLLFIAILTYYILSVSSGVFTIKKDVDKKFTDLPTPLSKDEVAEIFATETVRIEAERVKVEAEAEAQSLLESQIAELNESKTLLETSLSDKETEISNLAKEEDELKLAAESATAKLIDATKAGDESSELLKVSKEADKKLKKFDPEKISLLRVEVQELEKEIDDLDNRIATMEK